MKRSKENQASTRRKFSKNETQEELLDTNIYLTYDSLRCIFRYLNIRELSIIAKVCRFWLEAANDEKLIRRGPYCFARYSTFQYSERIQKGILANCIKQSNIEPFIALFFTSTRTSSDTQSITFS